MQYPAVLSIQSPTEWELFQGVNTIGPSIKVNASLKVKINEAISKLQTTIHEKPGMT